MLPHLARLVPDFRYRVLGALPEVRDWVAGSGLAAQVEFCDPVHDEAGLAGFLDTVSVLAHANATGESFGLAIAEAMAAGLPVVTHPCPPPRDNAQLELVEHGRTGLVADSAEDYASAVAWLLRHPDEARRMGRAGQDKARALYRAQSVARRLETFYDALLAPHAHIAPPQPAPALCRVHG
jgi:glycosyltransferase involved in cell wall biosynthesis